MIEVKRNENETSLSIIRRFTKRIQQSGTLKRARGLRFKKRTESDLIKKKKAIKNTKMKKRAEYLWKIGKTDIKRF
jgi:ribosomal protein S21